MSGPSLRLGVPPRSLFRFPPDNAPPALSPPTANALNPLAAPFGIDATLFNSVLHPAVPITIGAVYATTVTLVNAYNRKHGNKPWKISKTSGFFAFVILHNVFLAVYSAVTCYAMGRAMYASWPGLNGDNGLVGAVDALCQIQGPRGLGDAVSYNPATGSWGVKNKSILMSGLGTPDPTDVGRIWNEGLAFWGWWFYLSKFYEVLDTFIILAKGKRSTTLQTYHHTGAMLAMWAGIRYMSPPIWMFVQINSGIHAMMYTYYTVSALGFRVPGAIKRTLTTMQITQFLIGAAFATIHLFIYYSVPVSTAYSVAKTARSAASAVSSAVASVATGVPETATATQGFGTVLKRLALRAAGEEGLAENIGSEPQHFLKDRVSGKVHDLVDSVSYETRYRNQYEWVQCLDTTGQSFAVWLNVLYLFPLTVLFSRFFYKSYLKRTSATTRDSSKTHNTKEAAKDAARGVSKTVEKEGRKVENGVIKAEERIRSKEGFNKSMAPHVLDLQEIEDMKKRIEQGYKEIINQQLDKGNSKRTVESKQEKTTNGSVKTEDAKSNGSAKANGSAKKEEEVKSTSNAKKEQEAQSNGSATKKKNAKSNGNVKGGNDAKPNGNSNVKKEESPEPSGLLSPPPSAAPTEAGAEETDGEILKEELIDAPTPEVLTADTEEIVADADDATTAESPGQGLLSTTNPLEEDKSYAAVIKDE